MVEKDPIDSHSLEALEFPAVREILASYAASAPGRTAVSHTGPFAHRRGAVRAQHQTSECVAIVSRGIRVPLAGIHDISRFIDTDTAAGPIEPTDLLEIAQTLNASSVLREFFAQLDPPAPHLCALAEGLEDFSELTARIGDTIDSDGTVADTASEHLAHCRRIIAQVASEIQSRLKSILQDPAMKDALANDRFLTRDRRPVIAVHENYRRWIPGVVLDRSRSGNTLFIQPEALGPLSNQLESALYDEHKEVTRILWELTAAIRSAGMAIAKSIRLMGLIDLIHARARFSIAYGMSCPEFSERDLLLRSARHPLLMAMSMTRHASDHCDDRVRHDVVPIDLRLGETFDQLIVTGPNTGGKTVAIKTLGLLSLMAKSGMHIPAAVGSRIPFFNHVFADIGDEQSLAQSLSTFSGHMARIVEILAHADRHSLVLLDELGAGTDPAEGAALATAILSDLHHRHVITMATTHLGALKEYAFATAGVENASVAFDTQRLAPTYELLIGQAGSSNALVICRRLGMNEKLLDRAATMVSQGDKDSSALMNKVQKSRRAAEKSRRAADRLKAQARQGIAAIEDMQQRLLSLHDVLHRQADRQIDRQMSAVVHLADELQRQTQHAPKPWSDLIAEYVDQIRRTAASVPLAQRRAAFASALQVGDTVYVLPVHAAGRVMRLRKSRRTVTVDVAGRAIELAFDQVCEVPGAGPSEKN